MGVEIEKKFLPASDAWRRLASPTAYRQGYVATAEQRTVRVRTVGDTGYLTIKGPSTGAARLEFEYQIPYRDALDLLDNLCDRPLIEKNRYKVEYRGFTWEIDEFFGENEGLVVAEIELESEDQHFEIPDWIGKEVTGDPRYFNACLAKNPYCNWKK